jgi:hypothetical protein
MAALSHAHERYNRQMQYYPIATSLLGAVKRAVSFAYAIKGAEKAEV